MTDLKITACSFFFLQWSSLFYMPSHLITHSPYQVETLSRDDLSSRLMLNVNVASVGSLMLPDSLITIMDVSYLKFN